MTSSSANDARRMWSRGSALANLFSNSAGPSGSARGVDMTGVRSLPERSELSMLSSGEDGLSPGLCLLLLAVEETETEESALRPLAPLGGCCVALRM